MSCFMDHSVLLAFWRCQTRSEFLPATCSRWIIRKSWVQQIRVRKRRRPLRAPVMSMFKESAAALNASRFPRKLQESRDVTPVERHLKATTDGGHADCLWGCGMVRGLTAILHCDDLDMDVTIAVTHADEQDYWRANWDDYKLAFISICYSGLTWLVCLYFIFYI